MLYHIRGELILADMSFAVIDCGGVGYKLFVSGNTLGKIAGKIGETVTLLTFMKVSDDAVDLYGFFDSEELDIFKMLISVSGVGAKSAISILSLMNPQKLAIAVSASDAKAIAKAQGIGSKTAQRIILELKDKISNGITSETPEIMTDLSETAKDNMASATETLLVLGYTRNEAAAALSGLDIANLELEEIVRLALKKSVRN